MSADRDGLPSGILGYHQRTKHAPTRYALGPAFLDWTSQPDPFRRFEGARQVDLPLLGDETPAFPGPASGPAPISCDALGLFLELAFGLSAWKSVEGSTWALRNNPSSGNLHPTEAYVALNALPGLANFGALYHYAPLAHALEERAIYEVPSPLPHNGFLLGFSSIAWREAWKYGERAFRYCQLDAGHAIGAAGQAAAALGWRCRVLSEPGDEEIAALLGLNRDDAFHRREEERPEALMWIATDGASFPSLDLRALFEAPRVFHGAANRLSEDHDGWPLVDRAFQFCRKAITGPLAPSQWRGLPTVAGASIGDVVRNRRSAQRMDGAAVLSRENFRWMLMATLAGAEPIVSAFAYPPRLTLALFVHRVEGVEPGLYLLERDAEITERLRAALSPAFEWTPVALDDLKLFRLRAGPCEREATHASCLQPIAGKGCFSVAMIADFDRTLREEDVFAYRRLHWEAGVIGQALYLWASASGLAATGIGCFFDDEIHALLGMAPGETQFQDLYHFTVGAAVEDTRILTLPAYDDKRRRSRVETR